MSDGESVGARVSRASIMGRMGGGGSSLESWPTMVGAETYDKFRYGEHCRSAFQADCVRCGWIVNARESRASIMGRLGGGGSSLESWSTMGGAETFDKFRYGEQCRSAFQADCVRCGWIVGARESRASIMGRLGGDGSSLESWPTMVGAETFDKFRYGEHCHSAFQAECVRCGWIVGAGELRASIMVRLGGGGSNLESWPTMVGAETFDKFRYGEHSRSAFQAGCVRCD
ncbi:hypothetical protein [Novipirellula caenicola]|uniref:hypothetical protein n=1 Tax=Novipirellula caenicola TaxID=1536901 RepID=UPI0031EB57EA